MSNGELYTIVTNKSAKGQKGSIVAIIEGVKSDEIIDVLKLLLTLIPKSKRDKVKEITLDMANSMHKICRESFPKALLVIDRFHVQQLACKAVQDIRIQHRWEAIDEENKEIKKIKALKEKNKKETKREKVEKYIPKEFSNGDTKKQILARSRYLLFKSREK